MANKQKKRKKIRVSKKVLELRWDKRKFAKKNDMKIPKKGPKKEKKRVAKNIEREYADFIVDRLNRGVNILSKVSNEDSKKVARLRDAIIELIINTELMKKIAKIYKKNPDEYPYLIYLPFMIHSTIRYYSRDKELLTENEVKISDKLDRETLLTISEVILRKPMKVYRKYDIPKEVVLEIAATIPTAKRITNNRRWMRTLISMLYELSTEEVIDHEPILKAISKLDKKPPFKLKELREMFFKELILTRTRNKNHSFTESQKTLNETLIDAAIAYMNDQKKSTIRTILKDYIRSRKTADSNKNDGRRIIRFTDIANSNSEFTNIKEVVLDLMSDDSNNELYLS